MAASVVAIKVNDSGNANVSITGVKRFQTIRSLESESYAFGKHLGETSKDRRAVPERVEAIQGHARALCAPHSSLKFDPAASEADRLRLEEAQKLQGDLENAQIRQGTAERNHQAVTQKMAETKKTSAEAPSSPVPMFLIFSLIIGATFYPAIFDLLTYHTRTNTAAISSVASLLFGVLFSYLAVMFKRDQDVPRVHWPLISGIAAAVGFALIRAYAVEFQVRNYMLIFGLMTIEIGVLICAEFVARMRESEYKKWRAFRGQLDHAEQVHAQSASYLQECKEAVADLRLRIQEFSEFVAECNAWSRRPEDIVAGVVAMGVAGYHDAIAANTGAERS